MLTLSTLSPLSELTRSARLPLRIDISWMKSRTPSQPGPTPGATAGPPPGPIIEPKPENDGTSAAQRFAIIQQILELNPTASTDFLTRFAVSDLESYLSHLQVAALPRGRSARWIRPDNTRGIAMSEPAA